MINNNKHFNASKGYHTSITVRRILLWPSNELFLQVSQSGYVNLINSHASLEVHRLICKKSLLGCHGKAHCTVTVWGKVVFTDGQFACWLGGWPFMKPLLI